MELFHAFLEQPSADTYEAVRSHVLASDTYDPASRELAEAEEAANAGDFERASDLLSNSMPNLLLSPSAHLLFAFMLHHSGEMEAAQTEGAIATLCVQAILNTGDGTATAPLRVLRDSDITDVIEALRKEPSAREALPGDLEQVTCTDGSVIVFRAGRA